MITKSINNNRLQQEESVNRAFSKQAVLFDKLDYENNLVILIRDNIRKHVMLYVKPNQTMLELNCGTGLDALYFTQNGLTVHATDNADGMLEEVDNKIKKYHTVNLSFQKCSFNNLTLLENKKYNHIFSNFGGLNCSDNLKMVIKDLDNYMISGSIAHLVIMPKYCVWEILFAFKVNFKLAFRRFMKNGSTSYVEGIPFMTYYYSPSYIKKSFGSHYEALSIKAMGCFIPPTYMNEMETNRPKLFKYLQKLDRIFADKWPFYNLGDHYVISMRKK